MSSDYIEHLDELVRELTAWCDSRIKVCREQELKFGALPIKGKRVSTAEMPQALIEAWAERRALQAVLRMLGREEPPMTPTPSAGRG